MSDQHAALAAALEGRYTLEGEVGQGGMATVYLAQDLRHHRKVAIKVLRPELSAVIGAERFLAEITTTANLQHPHILPLHDSGTVNGTVFYVMPYVEGESLRDRITREKQLPIPEAIRIACEVADALDYAHRHGVIHRDIKPENILLHDGRALVADFGIALAATSAGSRMTETGMSLGTPHYMSPEQAMGERTLDARTDVYAIGCVLFEMLTGEPPFTGPTAQSIVAKVMTERPALPSASRDTVPEYVEDAVLTALAKLPADRFASAAEFAAALRGAGTGTIRRSRTRPAARMGRRAGVLWPVALGLAIGAALWGWLRPAAPVVEVPSSLLSIAVPEFGGASTGLQRQIAISPDGSTILYTAVHDGVNTTMRRDLDAAESVPIAGVPPFLADYSFSQDGRQVVGSDYSSRTSYRFPIDGGNARPLPEAMVYPQEIRWQQDGVLWVDNTGESNRGLMRVGEDNAVTIPFGVKSASVIPSVLLPGDRFVVGIFRPSGTSTGPIVILDLQDGAVVPLLDAQVVQLRYSSGFLVYSLTNGSIEAVPFDPDARRVTGRSVTIATGISLSGTGASQFDLSRTGTLVYVPEEARSLVYVDRAGMIRPVTDEKRNFHSPRFSPDGRRIALDFTGVDGRDVWLLNRADGGMTRSTFARDGHDPSWAPDGRSLNYLATTGGVLGIHRVSPGSSQPAESLLTTPQVGYTGVWLPDQSGIVTVSLDSATGNDIGLITNGGRGPITPLVATRFAETYPAVSPDGRWLAFVSNLSGRDELYLRPLAGDGEQIQLSIGGGSEPVWHPSGGELFYRGGEAGKPQLNAVKLAFATVPTVTLRTALFSLAAYSPATPHANYDISPDGSTFVMVRLNPSTRIMVLQNLPGYIRRLNGNQGAKP